MILFASFFSGSLSAAAPLLSRLAACEVVLAGPHRDLSEKASPLASVRYLSQVLQKRSLTQTDEVYHYEDAEFNGPLDQLPSKDAQFLNWRLRGVEKDLTSMNSQLQFLAFEFRGQALKDSLDLMKEYETRIRSLNSEIKKTYRRTMFYNPILYSFWKGLYLSGYGAGLVSVGAIAHEMFNGALSFDDLILLGGSVWSVGSLIGHYRKNKTRLDENYTKLKQHLEFMALNPDPDFLFISSSHLEVPVELHRYLMIAKKGGLHQQQEDEMKEALRLHPEDFDIVMRETIVGDSNYGEMGSFEGQFKDKKKVKYVNLMRRATFKSPLNQLAYLDHFVYFDKEKNEPVWLLFYRSFDSKPENRWPKKKKNKDTMKKPALSDSWVLPAST